MQAHLVLHPLRLHFRKDFPLLFCSSTKEAGCSSLCLPTPFPPPHTPPTHAFVFALGFHVKWHVGAHRSQKLTGSILVPFPVEACLSGVGENHPYQMYRTVVDKPFSSGQTLLQFGAVDWQAVVYVNGKLAGNHSGGYDGFALDVYVV